MSKLITIKKSTIFKHVCKNGHVIRCGYFTLRFLSAITDLNKKATSDSLLINKIQFGFIISKKVGCAVERNYIRRRLKEAIKLRLNKFENHGFYIFIVNKELGFVRFDNILQDIDAALIKLKLLNFNENIS